MRSKKNNILKDPPILKKVIINEVNNTIGESPNTTVLEFNFDNVICYLSIAGAYKLERDLKEILHKL